ncbi:MAG: selenium cofactor biosynthesis protein YqeC [Acidimicrobiales bacterium]
MPDPIDIDQLAAALAPGATSVVSLVGGGGKTTALFALGRQLPGRVLLSTTTKMGSDRRDGLEPLVGATAAQISAALDRDRVALAWKRVEDHRAVGYPPAECTAWHGLADHLVLEADGSRRRPFKAPAEHEPVVPGATTLLVACVGAAAFGAPIEEVCHRPESVARLAGCETGDVLSPVRLAAVLTSPAGSRKDCPPAARFVVLANQVSPGDGDFIDELVGHLGDDAPLVAVASFTEPRR